MHEFFDLRTLSVNNILVSLSFGMCLILYGRKYPQLEGIKIAGIAFLMSSGGFLLLGFRNFIPDFFSIIIPNLMLVISMALIHACLLLLYEFTLNKMLWLHSGLFLVVLILFFIFTYGHYNTNARIVIISFTISMQCAFILSTLLVAHRINDHKANFVIAMAFLFFSGFFFFRGVLTLSEKPLLDFMDAGMLHAWSVIVYEFIVIITSFGLVWIVSHKIHSVLKEQANHDPLTRVLNRRALEEILNIEHSRSIRNQSPLSVIMLDIDYFKRLNDRYGHNIGDQVLVFVADILIKNTRGYDSIARFGGEEFIILLPDTPIDQARLIAEKLKDKVANYEYRIKDNRKLTLTASFGVTSCHLSKEPWLKVLDRCDRALYLAKESGRNKVIAFNDDNEDAETVTAG